MRILVINPNTSEEMTDAIGEVAKGAASPGTEVVCVHPSGGPRSIEGHADEVIAAYFTLETVAATVGEYDGYVIACYGDPALAACREVSSVPVVGIAEASFHVGSLVAHKWSVVSVLPRVKPLLEDVVRANGMESRCASIRCTPLSVLEIEEDLDRAIRLVQEEGRSAVQEDGAECILLGCAGFGPIDKKIQAELGVPVIDGTGCAVRLVETLVDYGVSSAKVRAYLAPERKELLTTAPNLSKFYQNL